jgi:hypothetical protein
MNDDIASKRSSLKTKLVAKNVLKTKHSLIPNTPADVAESLIWNTLIPSRPELPYDIDDSNDNENEEEEEEEEEEDIDNDDEDVDLSLVLVEGEETDYTC